MPDLMTQASDALRPPESSPEWFSNIIAKLKLEKFLQYIGITVSEAFVVFYFFMAGFFVGFAFKKYFRFILGCTSIIIGLAIVLESRNILTIDWEALKAFIGLEVPGTNINTLWEAISAWVSNNVHNTIGIVIGFILGYKCG